MNHTAATIPENMDIDPLSSYEYPAYDSFAAQSYPYPSKLQQSIYQAYQQTNTNYSNTQPAQPQEPFTNPPPTSQTAIDIEIPPKNEETDSKPVLKKRRKEKSTYCSEKITDATFKFYGCSVCNISYNALHDLDQHVTVHKNRMTSYRLRLRNQFKKKQIKKEKKRLNKNNKMVKIKTEKEFEIEIKPEDGYIGEEKAADVISNGINPDSECNGINTDSECNGINPDSECNGINPDSECNGNVDNENSVIEAQNSQINSNNVTNSINNNQQNNDTNSLSNGKGDDENSELDKGSSMNSKDKENSMDEAELNNLEKIYKCFACQKQFTLSYYLKLHVRSHTDEKPYTCSVCGQSFITASKLGRHNKRIHLAERYQCRICFKIYSRFELLTAHFDKTHPEDKLEGEPYDYNAILPYLKELEEQLLAPGLADLDNKPKSEDLFWEQHVGPHQLGGARTKAPVDIKEEAQDEDQKELVPKLDILIEEVKVDFDDVTVKRELSDDEPPADAPDDADDGPGGPGDGPGGPGDGADVKDEDSQSDSDYFPSNTWAAAPPPRAPSPARRGARACGVCHKRVSTASYLRVHMRTHTGERPFKCYKCGRGFITSSKMHRHVLTHAQDKDDVKTEGEDAKPEVDDNMDEDQQQGDSAKKPAKKKSKMKSKSSKLKSGEEKPRRKHQKRPHACEYCNQKFLHLNMLEVHRQSHAGEALVLRCHYCLQEAPGDAALRAHEAEHQGAKPYLCTVCGKTYKKRETMVYHRKRHAPDKEFVCDVCSKRFPAACKLHKHLLTHRRDAFVLRYECPVCAHMFHTRYHVHMHLSTHQKEGLILEENRSEILAMVLQNARKIPRAGASQAPPAAPAAPAHAEHAHAEHAHAEHAHAAPAHALPPDERSRVCNICGAVFSHFYYLEEHLKSHGERIAVADLDKPEDKKYICQICNKGFKLHYYLKLHSFTHSKEKPFICQQCGKGFITKGKLKRHLETHTGLKKYQCHICYKFFTRPSYLRIHVRTIHGTQDYNFRFDKGYGLGSLAPTMAMSDVSQNSI